MKIASSALVTSITKAPPQPVTVLPEISKFPFRNNFSARDTAINRDLIGGLKAAIAASRHSTSLEIWLNLAQASEAALSTAFEDFWRQLCKDHRLRILSIDTTGACDLRCPSMCYYHPGIALDRGLVDEFVLQQAIVDSVRDLNIELLMFMGKEPLLNPKRLFSLLSFVGPASERSFRTGLVSNGRNFNKRAAALTEAIENSQLDFIDVSIDSADNMVHDSIRGLPGSWQLTMEGVRWLAKQWSAYPLSIVSTLRRDNSGSILPLIDLCSGICRRYQIQVIQPPPYVSAPPLSSSFVIAFFENLLAHLSGSLQGRNLNVGFELHGCYIYDFLQAGFIRASAIREDEEGQLYVPLEAAGNRLTVLLEILPLQAWRLGRILYDGSYLAHMHFLQAANPFHLSVGRIQDEPISTLYAKSIRLGSRFHDIVESRSSHDCKNRPCWRSCFGGWNGAENAFVSKQSLSAQPYLCTKGREV
jgi:hypothetical protein